MTSLYRQKACGDERHFFIRHLEIRELLLPSLRKLTQRYLAPFTITVVIDRLSHMTLN